MISLQEVAILISEYIDSFILDLKGEIPNITGVDICGV